MIDPEFTKLALDELIADAGVSLLLHSYLIGAQADGHASPRSPSPITAGCAGSAPCVRRRQR